MRDAERVGRIEGLDLWRAVLMIAGVLYHGVTLRPDLPIYRVIILASNSCRMGLFFGISGLVVAKALDRHEPRAWLRHRLICLGVPTVFGLLVICPLTALALTIAPAAIRMPITFPQWYHLWFMVALLAYTPVGYWLYKQDREQRLFAALDADEALRAKGQLLMLAVVPLVSFALMQIAFTVVTRFTPMVHWNMLLQLRPAAGYLPMFVLGFALGRAPRLRERVTAELGWPVVLSAATIGGYVLWFAWGVDQVAAADRGWMQAVMLEAGSALAPPALFALVLRSAYAIPRLGRPWRELSDASFTVYLVHFPIVLAINGLFIRLNWNEYFEYGVAVAVTLVLSYAIHAGLVKRSRVAAFLLNGVHTRRASGHRLPAVVPVGQVTEA